MWTRQRLSICFPCLSCFLSPFRYPDLLRFLLSHQRLHLPDPKTGPDQHLCPFFLSLFAYFISTCRPPRLMLPDRSLWLLIGSQQTFGLKQCAICTCSTSSSSVLYDLGDTQKCRNVPNGARYGRCGACSLPKAFIFDVCWSLLCASPIASPKTSLLSAAGKHKRRINGHLLLSKIAVQDLYPCVTSSTPRFLQYRNDPKPIERTCSRNMLALIHGVLIYRVQISTILVRACLPVQPLRCRCLENLWRLGHEVYFRILQRSSQAHPCAQKPRPFPP